MMVYLKQLNFLAGKSSKGDRLKKGKEIGLTVDPTVSQDDMGSQSDDGFSASYDLPQVDVTASQEDDTAIERIFGKNVATDFFGDLYRAYSQGLAQGATVDEAFDIYKKGKNISDAELNRYIEVNKDLDGSFARGNLEKSFSNRWQPKD